MKKELSNFHSSGAKQTIDRVIDILYAGGVNNPMDAIEQISYLLFLKILNESKESKKYSWKRLISLEGENLIDEMQMIIKNIHTLSDLSQIGKTLFYQSTLKILDPQTLKAVIMEIDSLSDHIVSKSDITGDVYEYLLNRISASGKNGQFRTQKHIIDMVVKLVDPKAGSAICDPACGTGGFLLAAKNHIVASDEKNEIVPWGFDNDTNLVKIASLNLYLNKIPKANIYYHNTVTTPFSGGYGRQKFSCILANPPFAGKVQKESIQKELCSEFSSRSTELLFLKWIIDHLEDGGRAGVIVPNGVLFGSTKAHKSIRKTLLEKCSLDGVISMPSGVFKPYSGVLTSILVFLFILSTNFSPC